MRTAPRIGSGLVGWRRLTVVAALANAVVLFGYGVTRGDREALVGAVVMLVGIGLLRVGTGLLGLLVLAALFVNIAFWMFPAANGNATYRIGPADLLVPGALVAFSLAGFMGAVAGLVHLRDPAAGRGAAAPTGVLAVVFIFASLGLGLDDNHAAPQVAPAGALEVETVNVAFVPDSLRASSGEVQVAVRNRDLFCTPSPSTPSASTSPPRWGDCARPPSRPGPAPTPITAESPGTPPWGCTARSPSAELVRLAALGIFLLAPRL